nr:DUF1971 domain-containing protein [Sphingomonas flavalba]
MSAPLPYRSSPVFDENNLPDALRHQHRTKPGVWGVLRVLDGEIALSFANGRPTERLSPGRPGLLYPDDPHWVTLNGPMRMQVDFYDRPPELPARDEETQR